MTGQEVLTTPETDLLRQQLLQAQRLCSVGELASSMAHEFNNILTTIINYAKLGQKAADLAAARNSLEKILKAGQRAAGIVSNMLGFARNGSAARQATDLTRLVDDVLALTEKDLTKHRIQVEKKFHDRPVAEVVPGQIEQILVNLIINA
ncbi:MAG TPA: histidine kinase dimerization/phospho-acceptor domain-containing protein, partial [Gemmataceae bacterium]